MHVVTRVGAVRGATVRGGAGGAARVGGPGRRVGQSELEELGAADGPVGGGRWGVGLVEGGRGGTRASWSQ